MACLSNMWRTLRHEVGATGGAATLLLRLLKAEPCQEVAGEDGGGEALFGVTNGGIGVGGKTVDEVEAGET